MGTQERGERGVTWKVGPADWVLPRVKQVARGKPLHGAGCSASVFCGDRDGQGDGGGERTAMYYT